MLNEDIVTLQKVWEDRGFSLVVTGGRDGWKFADDISQLL